MPGGPAALRADRRGDRRGESVTTRFSTQMFGAGGLLSRVYPGFELRPGQIRMSEAIAEAIELRRHLIMEAPTGTGKTFAYLVPAIESGRKAVISTGTKNLQEQLFFKDLPRLQEALGRPVRAAYMKGRDNYLCIKRFRDFEENPLFDEMDEVGFHRTLTDWSRTTESGDRGELGELPESLTVRCCGCSGSLSIATPSPGRVGYWRSDTRTLPT